MENNHFRTLILVSFAWLLIFVGRITPSTLLVQMTNDLHMSDFQAGVALSGIWFFYGVLQFPSGVFADALGRKKIIVFSLIGFSIASILIGLSNSFIIAGVTFCLIGMASGLLPSPSFTLIAELFGSKKGKALGIHSSIGSISGFIPIILPILAVSFGWRNIFFLWGIIGIILAYSIFIFADESLKNPEYISYITRLKEMIKSIGNREILFMFLINIAISIVWMGILSWFPSYIQQDKGFRPEIAGLLFSIVLSGGLILKPVIGHLSDKTNRF
ncbi:MAG TPA: MFS transporter, partial [Thermoplasmatales archaeon]|nr:MFS transporter [Thermoplasmatales archaeon]